MTLQGGNGNDFIRVDQLQRRHALAHRGRRRGRHRAHGQRQLPGNITSISALSFDGQGGYRRSCASTTLSAAGRLELHAQFDQHHDRQRLVLHHRRRFGQRAHRSSTPARATTSSACERRQRCIDHRQRGRRIRRHARRLAHRSRSLRVSGILGACRLSRRRRRWTRLRVYNNHGTGTRTTHLDARQHRRVPRRNLFATRRIGPIQRRDQYLQRRARASN